MAIMQAVVIPVVACLFVNTMTTAAHNFLMRMPKLIRTKKQQRLKDAANFTCENKPIYAG
jgi:hypothetical protein